MAPQSPSKCEAYVVGQVLPDFKRCPAPAGPGGAPELAHEKEWWDSVVRRFLHSSTGGQVSLPKHRRIATYWWLLALNNILVRCAGYGLERYRSVGSPGLPGLGDGPPSQTPGQLQPMLALNIDQCSVGWSAIFYMSMKLKLRVLPIFDPSHRCWNDCKLALQYANMWEVVLLVSIICNINHGPFQNAGWWRQGQEACSAYMESAGHAGCPLFRSQLKNIARDTGRSDWKQLLRDEEWIQETWDSLQSVPGIGTKGPKVALCRWMSFFDCFAWLDKAWHCRLLVGMYWGLALHFIDGSIQSKTLRLKGIQREPAEGAKQTMKEAQACTQKVRDTGKNTMHVVVLLLMQTTLQRKCRIIVMIARSVREAFTHQAKTLRSAQQCREWYAQQAAGLGLLPLYGCFRSACSWDALQYMHFCVTCEEMPDLGSEGTEHPAVLDENQWAHEVMTWCFQLVRCRLRSELHCMEGYPMGLAFALADSCQAHEQGLKQMQSTHEAFEDASVIAQDNVTVQAMCRRSYMNMPAVAEVFELVKCEGFLEVPGPLREAAHALFALGQSEVVESAFQRCRVVETRHQSSVRVSKPRLWHTALQRQVLTKVHAFDEVQPTDCSLQRASQLGQRVADEVYKPSSVQPKLPLKTVVGTASPDWVSFSPLSQAQQFSDMALFRHCQQTPADWDRCDMSWLCSLASCGMLVRHVDRPDNWYWSLGSIEAGTAIGWETDVQKIGGVQLFFPRHAPVPGEKPYTWLCILSESEWLAQPVKWVSPMHVLAVSSARSRSTASASSGGAAAPKLPLCAAADGEPIPLLQAAALTSFKGLTETLVRELAKHLQAPMQAHSVLLFVVWVSLS